MAELSAAKQAPAEEEVGESETETPDNALERVLDLVDSSAADASPRTTPDERVFMPPREGLFVALLASIDGQRAHLSDPASGETFVATIGPHLDAKYLAAQQGNGRAALVQGSSESPVIVGLVDVGPSRHHTIEAEEIELKATRQLTLRSGRSALRLQADGSLELLGSRISATSRGLLRLAGRALRLN